MCVFRNSAAGVEYEPSRLNILVEAGEGGAVDVTAMDETNALGGKALSAIQGDLAVRPGNRDYVLTGDPSDLEGALLLMHSAPEPQFFNDGPEVLVGMLGSLIEDDPREGSCMMMTGEVREVFEGLNKTETAQ